MSRNLDALRSAYALLGPRVAFKLLIVSSIPPELSGKYRPARSHVASSYEGVALPAIGT